MNRQDAHLEQRDMNEEPTSDDLQSLRAWSTAVRVWRIDGAEVLAEHGLTWSSFDTLLALADGPRRSGQLCSELGMTTGGMAKLLRRLESMSVIERSRGKEVDLRTITVELTEAGATLVRTAGREIYQMREADYSRWGLSAKSQTAMVEAWDLLRTHHIEA